MALAEELGLGAGNVLSVSLGQGQATFAHACMQEAAQAGKWVALQNCHLAASFMPELERKDGGIHPTFRLWLTSAPLFALPIAVLQACVKLTLEPPLGLRANLLSLLEQPPVNEKNFFEQDAVPKPLAPRLRRAPSAAAALLATNPANADGIAPLPPPSTDPATCAYRRLLFQLCFFHALVQVFMARS
ncbi:dynein heavy chain and region D6 of dynein motor-domain-containing protein [Pavlovales sp. CCMP2436]|nr:dynein heavy chain and region D6 of dynein motor-domain-containing protein [Pavlovales sp. CCMP2436]